MTTDPLTTEYARVRDVHSRSLVRFTVRSALPASVIRGMAPGTKAALTARLEHIPVDELLSIEAEPAYRGWFEAQLDPLGRIIRRLSPPNVKPRLYPGYKWGHAAKVLSLFVRDLVLRSRYFRDEDADRIAPMLCCPIDGVVLKRLKQIGVGVGVERIYQVDSKRLYWSIQDQLEAAARSVSVPRVWFDDVWGDRTREDV
jgi:hypothetical protein